MNSSKSLSKDGVKTVEVRVFSHIAIVTVLEQGAIILTTASTVTPTRTRTRDAYYPYMVQIAT